MMTQRDREQWLRGKGGRQEAGPVIALQSEEVNMEELAAWTFFFVFCFLSFPFFFGFHFAPFCHICSVKADKAVLSSELVSVTA